MLQSMPEVCPMHRLLLLRMIVRVSGVWSIKIRITLHIPSSGTAATLPQFDPSLGNLVKVEYYIYQYAGVFLPD